MCGICGFVSAGQSVSPVPLAMLRTMEAHGLGFESCGMATVLKKRIVQMKNIGSVDNVFPSWVYWSKILSGRIGLGHVRYPSKISPVGLGKFAHPFVSCDSDIALIHNGTIYDFEKIVCELSPRHEFSSYDSEHGVLNDSEVIVHLLEEEVVYSKGDLLEAVRRTCKRLSENPKNQFLFAFIHLREPSKIYLVSGRDYESKRKVVVASRYEFGAVFASYRETGIDGQKPIKFEALKPYINLEQDRVEILDYDTVAILTRNGYLRRVLKA